MANIGLNVASLGLPAKPSFMGVVQYITKWTFSPGYGALT